MTREEFIERLKSVGFYYPSREVLDKRGYIVQVCFGVILFYDYDNGDCITINPNYSNEYYAHDDKVLVTLKIKAVGYPNGYKYKSFSSYDEAWGYLND